MCHILYSDNKEPFKGGFIDPYKIDGTKKYLEHYSNLLYLQFIFNHKDTSRVEKQQASKEITICEKKLKYWEHNPNYDHKRVLTGIGELKAQWIGR